MQDELAREAGLRGSQFVNEFLTQDIRRKSAGSGIRNPIRDLKALRLSDMGGLIIVPPIIRVMFRVLRDHPEAPFALRLLEHE